VTKPPVHPAHELQCAAIKLVAHVHPVDFICHSKLVRLMAIKQRTLNLSAIAEAVGQKLIENLIAPARWARMQAATRFQISLCEGRWNQFFDWGDH